MGPDSQHWFGDQDGARAYRVEPGHRLAGARQEHQVSRRGDVLAFRRLDVERAVSVKEDRLNTAETGCGHRGCVALARETCPSRALQEEPPGPSCVSCGRGPVDTSSGPASPRLLRPL